MNGSSAAATCPPNRSRSSSSTRTSPQRPRRCLRSKRPETPTTSPTSWRYTTSDDLTTGWIVVACPKESLWRRFCQAIELPNLSDDPRFESFALRDANRGELLPILEARLRTRPSVEWLAAFSTHGVPAAAVNDIAEAFDDPQAIARGAIQESSHPELGLVRQVASPFRFD